MVTSIMNLGVAITLVLFFGILKAEDFQVEYDWSYINFTWRSQSHYNAAVQRGSYIPENILISGMKVYEDKIYFTLPKFRKGVPVTLAYIPKNSEKKTNNLLTPFPDWINNDDRKCIHLQNAQSMEIDTKGVMWILDGTRLNANTNCPPKLVLIDLNKGGRFVHSYIFPNEVCLQDGGFLNDLVIDDSEGQHVYAYITDTSPIDPGLIVYSRAQNRAWKLRDSTMFVEKNGPVYAIDNVPVEFTAAIDGIALSPKKESTANRTVFYSPATGYDLFSISTSAIKDETKYKLGSWRESVQLVGKKIGSTDGMMMDNTGNLYYSLTSLNAVGLWNINSPFNTTTLLYQNNEKMIWPDAFGIEQGDLYLISNHIVTFINTNVTLRLSPDIKFRVWKYHTGSQNYEFLLKSK